MFVTPTIDGKIRKYPVLAGIETEVEEDNNVVYLPRIYLIEAEGEKCLYFCYRKGKKTGRKGGYGMILDETTMNKFHSQPTDSQNLPELKKHLKKLMESIP